MRLAPRFHNLKRPLALGLAAGTALLLVVFLLWVVGRRNQAETIVIPVMVPLSGTQAEEARDVINAVNLYVRQVNQAGGIRGHQLRLTPVDDALDPTVARERAGQVVASDALIAIGPLNSVAALAAAPVFGDHHVAAITGSATVDGLTDGNPYYFRALFDNSGEGSALAAYAHTVLGYDRATVVYTDEPFGRSLLASFQTSFEQNGGIVSRALRYDMTPSAAADSAQQIAAALVSDPDPGLILLATTGDTMARDVIVATRRAGVHPQFLGADSVGGDTFPQRFQTLPEEQQHRGYFLDGVYAASPIIFDSANDTAQAFVNSYRQAYGRDPGWREAKYYDVAHLVVDALRNASPQFGHGSRVADRERVRDALAAIDSPQAAVNATTGPVFFDSHNSLSQPVRIGRFVQNQFVSAPVQLAVMTNPDGLNVADALAAGSLVRLGDQHAWLQHVVYTGIDINQITAIDESRGVFTADLYLWFLYTGDDSVLDVEILNSAGANFDPKAPLAADEVGGLHHRLYRVRGDFKVDYNLHDYPFDRQFLTVQIQNVHLSRDQVIYAIDASSRHLALSDDSDANPLRGLSSWSLGDVRQDEATSRSLSTRGYASAAGLRPLSEYSTREVTITAQRRTSIFLVKTLLPLALLTCIVFTTLFLSVDDGFEARTLDASALLAAAVLLVAINQSIRASYTIAIEYAFYVFFGLCLFCMVVHLADERLQETRHAQRARRVHTWSRLVYALVVAVLVAAYALRFGSRFI